MKCLYLLIPFVLVSLDAQPPVASAPKKIVRKRRIGLSTEETKKLRGWVSVQRREEIDNKRSAARKGKESVDSTNAWRDSMHSQIEKVWEIVDKVDEELKAIRAVTKLLAEKQGISWPEFDKFFEVE